MSGPENPNYESTESSDLDLKSIIDAYVAEVGKLPTHQIQSELHGISGIIARNVRRIGSSETTRDAPSEIRNPKL